MNLTQLALVLLTTFSPASKDTGDVVVRAIAQAVEADTEPPITGSKEGDLALEIAFADGESNFRAVDKKGECLRGDGGAALGPMQLQHVAEPLACAPATAAKIWLAMAHDSVKRCASLDPDARLAVVTSGNCSHGLALSRHRFRLARQALSAVLPHE